ncbi:hypothetical protein ACGFII_10905 [Micromonospora chalcea]
MTQDRVLVPRHDSAASPATADTRPHLKFHGEPVTITNFRDTLPATATPAERLAMVKAGRGAGLHLDDDGLHAVARALTDPAAVARAIKAGLLTGESVGPATLAVAHGHVYLTELLPILQPRAGAAARTVDPPKIVGCLDGDIPEAMIELWFRDEEHLVEHLAQTVRQTRAMGSHYEASILTKRVSREIMVHTARIMFEDDSEPFVVLIVRDGLTRVVSSWAALYPDLGVDQLAEKMVSVLLAAKVGRKDSDTETAVRARGRAEVLQNMRVRFVQGVAGEAPNEDALRIGQALTPPAQVILSTDTVGVPGVAPAEQFDDAVQALVASVHGEFKPWEPSASDAAAVVRALPRAVYDGDLDENVARIATGYLPVKDLPTVFGKTVPATALWRAVYLAAYLCAPVEFAAIKRHLRDQLGVSRIENRTYVGHLMTLIDLPWRQAKQDTRRQALRAWQNGGPIPHEILGVDWDPVPVSDFTALVPKALAGDVNARYTLQVAGGIALVADKLLLSNTGSAADREQVPFRSDVNDVVAGLGTSADGLWLLARAANAFRADRRAINSYTSQELQRTSPAAGSYVVPRPRPDDPSKLLHDNAGQPDPLVPYWVVHYSDPARTAQEKAKKAAAPKPAPTTESGAAKVVRLRAAVQSQLNAALADLKTLITLGSADLSLEPVLGDQATWKSLVDTNSEINGALYSARPPAPSVVVTVPDEEDDEDEDEFA